MPEEDCLDSLFLSGFVSYLSGRDRGDPCRLFSIYGWNIEIRS